MGKIVRTISRDGGVLCCAIDSTDMAAAAEVAKNICYQNIKEALGL